MKKVLAAILALASTPAFAEEKPWLIPLNSQERQVILAACEAAVWANRVQFTGLCDQLKARFEAAKPEPATEPKQ